MKRILVIGGTGMLGEPVSHCLQEAGVLVRIMTRDVQKAQKKFDNSFELFDGNPVDLSCLEEALEGCHGVHISLPNDVEQQVAESVAKVAARHHIQRISYISGATVAEDHRWFEMVNRKFLAEQAIRQCAGRLNLTRALYPGLLFDIPLADYQAFISGTKPIETLNIPSLAQTRCALWCAWTRSAENVLTTTAAYTWSVAVSTSGLTVTLDQPGYVFAPGEMRAFTVTANVTALPADGSYAFTRVILHETATGIVVHLPLAVIRAGTAFDAAVDISTPRDSGGETFQGVVG